MLSWRANDNKMNRKEPGATVRAMVTIYQDYDQEPEDIFQLLPERLACSFYALEMDGYTADIDFFKPLLPNQGPILELGCGTGRITRKIAGSDRPGRLVIGIDISLPMLHLAIQADPPYMDNTRYLCMDMVQLAFRVDFAAILIPYNTLNLLGSRDRIRQCLGGCRNLLQPGGRLLVQLFVPSREFVLQQKTFQFQMFNRPKGEKIIKEIRKHYIPQNQSVRIEERFRVRPMQAGKANEDWHRIYTVAGFSADCWLSLFQQAGFTLVNTYGDYTGGCYSNAASSTLLATFTL